jgi:chromosomal replication initiation ATPase DnaA
MKHYKLTQKDLAIAAGIMARIERELGITPAQIMGRRRLESHCRARHLALYAISKALPHVNDTQIARMCRNTHPTSVIKAYYSTVKRREIDHEFDQIAERVLA